MRAVTVSRVAWLVFAASLLALYQGVILKLAHDWANDDNYSHGFLIVPLALYFAWERRKRLPPAAPSMWGLPLVLCGLGALLAGTLGAELFLTRISIIGTLAGSIVFLLGWATLRTLAFPVAFLLLMIPLPAIVFNEIAFPLQLLASRVAESTLETMRIPVLREGNVIFLANSTLEVAEACSGIRSLISLLTLGIVYGYFLDQRIGVRLGITALTVPIAVIANAARVAGTGIAAQLYGADVALGFFHTFSGWLVFAFAFLMLLAATRLIVRLAPVPQSEQPSPAIAA